MKKLLIAFAVLAVFAISFVSFTSFKSSSVPVSKEDQTTYRWLFWGCRPEGSAYQFTVGPNGRSGFDSYGETIPAGHCPGTTGNVCAVRFLVSETEPIPGSTDGGCRPKAGVTIWGVGRPWITCQQ